MSVLSSRTQRILEAPVLPLLLSLAAPNIGEAAARITFLTADAMFVSWLGSDALAGVAVVFPLFLILQTATASGFGSGVSSAIGRALGAGDHGRAASLAGVAVAIALIGGALTTALMLATGPALYAAMGLTGRAVEMAVLYGAVMFGGSVLVWLMNLLANVSRGAGNMMVPAFAIAIGEAFHLALSPALILGWGPFPALGIVGAALAAVVAYGVGAIVLVVHLVSRQALVRLRLGAIRLKREEAAAILGVGVVSAASATLFQVSTFFVAGIIAVLGSSTVAAYGAAVRLELLQYPITFAFGSAVITMVATAAGARDFARAATRGLDRRCGGGGHRPGLHRGRPVRSAVDGPVHVRPWDPRHGRALSPQPSRSVSADRRRSRLLLRLPRHRLRRLALCLGCAAAGADRGRRVACLDAHRRCGRAVCDGGRGHRQLRRRPAHRHARAVPPPGGLSSEAGNSDLCAAFTGPAGRTSVRPKDGGRPHVE